VYPNFTSNLEKRVKQIEDGQVQNGFCWGNGLGPKGDFRTMFGKVAGCLLDKAEVLAQQWEIATPNLTVAVEAPGHWYRMVCTDMAACCVFTSRKGWCLSKIGPVYGKLAQMAEDADKDVEHALDKSDELAGVVADLTQAASELLDDIKEGYSDRAALLMSTCPSGTRCSAADLDRLRRELQDMEAS